MKDTTYEMFELFEMTPDLVCINGKDGYFRKVNPAVMQKLGYSEDELLSRPVFDFLHPDDRERTGKVRESLLAGIPLHNFQNRYCTKKGDILWLEWTSIYFPEKEVVFAIAKDITTRKLMELESDERSLKFRALATHFKSSLEKDRKALADSLHEQLAQVATAVNLDISFLQAVLPQPDGPAKERMDRAFTSSAQLVEMIRQLYFSISPNMLDEMGLKEVMDWLCYQFMRQHGIKCIYYASFDEQTMPADLRLDVFRICQERLAGISRHQKATQVDIRLQQVKQTWQLTICDDGKEEEESLQIGLADIRERVTSVDGRLTLKTGDATRLLVTVAIPA